MIAETSPMGWNSWDCYGACVTEETVRKNADYMAKYLKPFGWEYVVVDIQWYEPTAVSNDYHNFCDVEIDEYGRVIPAVNRFPSSADGAGFRPLADYVHSLGLKFGIHIMRGIPRIAVSRNAKILDSDKHARDVARLCVMRDGDRYPISDTCFWNTDMYGVDPAKDGAKAYYDSIFSLYASWGVDFIKCDDIARELPHHEDELKLISSCIRSCGRDMVFSVSPGPSLLEKADLYKEYTNMWRITDDFWDDWRLLYAMFERAAKWAPHAGPGHWPDADMLPVGALRQCYDPNGWTHFTEDEQYTHLTLWSLIRSPLMIGGELTKCDKFTLDLLTNKDVLAMHKNARGSHEIFRRTVNGCEVSLWTAVSADGGFYVALFNLGDADADVTVSAKEFELNDRVEGHELWTGKKIAFDEKIRFSVKPHGVKVYLLK